MCRNIRTLHNFAPPATVEEIRASSLQFVRKLSGFTRDERPTPRSRSRGVPSPSPGGQSLPFRRLPALERGSILDLATLGRPTERDPGGEAVELR